MLRRYSILLLLLLLIGTASCGGELVADEPGKWDGEWNSSLDSGTVFLMEARGASIAVSTDLGFMVSADQGEYFDKPALEGLGDARVTGIVLRADKWFVASNQGQLWESTSEGFNWKFVGQLPVATEVRLSGAGQDLIAALRTGRVYRSNDDGRTWNLSDTGITAQEVRTVYYHTSNALLLAAPILEPVLYRSTDFGETWSAVDSGYDATAVLDFTGLGKDIYAAAGDRGIYHSTNKGISWESAVAGLPARVFVQAMHADKKVVYAGGVFSDQDESDRH